MPFDEKRMSFWEHLEELRWTIFKIISVLFIGVLTCWAAAKPIFSLLRAPISGVEGVELMLTGPLDGFMIHLKIALLAAIVITSPVIFWFCWQFVAPGLTPKEQKMGWWTVSAGTLFFLAGAAFAYRLLPIAVSLFLTFGFDDVENRWYLKTYMDLVLRLILAFGVLFELPVVIALLVRLGLVQVETLQKGRPYAIIMAFVVAAFLTPPDPVTQVMLGVPLVVLYEVGILVGRWQARRRLKDEGEEEARQKEEDERDRAEAAARRAEAGEHAEADEDAATGKTGEYEAVDESEANGVFEDEYDYYEDYEDYDGYTYDEEEAKKRVESLEDLPSLFSGKGLFGSDDEETGAGEALAAEGFGPEPVEDVAIAPTPDDEGRGLAAETDLPEATRTEEAPGEEPAADVVEPSAEDSDGTDAGVEKEAVNDDGEESPPDGQRP